MKIGIVWATGAVGQELLPLLQKREFPVWELRLFGSGKSANKTIETPYGSRVIQLLSDEWLQWLDAIFFAASADVSREWCPRAAEQWIVCVDKSSAFRSDPSIPLVVPEVNGESIHQSDMILSSPNCTATIGALALWPIHKALWLKKVFASTYQAASGAGQPAMEELIASTRAKLSGESFAPVQFDHDLWLNLFPHIGNFEANGYTDEEMKFTNELRRILGLPHLPIDCTSVRVPILRAHSEDITVETEQPFITAEVRRILSEAAWVELRDNPQWKLYPMPSSVTGKYDVEVGRVRQSFSFDGHGGRFFVSGDQLLKGAALNGLQILEHVFKQRRKV